VPSSTVRADGITAGSSWSDLEAGTTEEAAFIGSSGRRILTFLHRPTAGSPAGGVVLCGSLYEDFQVNYRLELLVARALARRGCATVRFQYRGVGNSDDLRGGMTFETMLADARAAASWLTARTGARPRAFVGSRLGALVAAQLAAGDDDSPLVVWSPIVDGADLFRGMSRASRLAGVRAEARKRRPKADAPGRPDDDGAVEMLGNLVQPASREDLEKRCLPRALGSRRVLLVQLGLGDAENQQYNSLVSEWTSHGARVDVLRVHMRQLWMVPDKWEPVEGRETTSEVVEGIAGWIAATGRASR
jgi:alpha/beta superfamily hydrolase